MAPRKKWFYTRHDPTDGVEYMLVSSSDETPCEQGNAALQRYVGTHFPAVALLRSRNPPTPGVFYGVDACARRRRLSYSRRSRWQNAPELGADRHLLLTSFMGLSARTVSLEVLRRRADQGSRVETPPCPPSALLPVLCTPSTTKRDEVSIYITGKLMPN